MLQSHDQWTSELPISRVCFPVSQLEWLRLGIMGWTSEPVNSRGMTTAVLGVVKLPGCGAFATLLLQWLRLQLHMGAAPVAYQNSEMCWESKTNRKSNKNIHNMKMFIVNLIKQTNYNNYALSELYTTYTIRHDFLFRKITTCAVKISTRSVTPCLPTDPEWDVWSRTRLNVPATTAPTAWAVLVLEAFLEDREHKKATTNCAQNETNVLPIAWNNHRSKWVQKKTHLTSGQKGTHRKPRLLLFFLAFLH